MDTRSKSKLGHLLIAKSMAEALLITAVSVGFYFASTNPYLRGVLDYADNQTVAGWAVDEAQPAAHVEVQLYIDGIFVGDQARVNFAPIFARRNALTMIGTVLFSSCRPFRLVSTRPESMARIQAAAAARAGHCS